MFPKRARLKKFDYVGRYRYVLTFCTHLRSRIFVTPAPVELVLSQIRQTAARHDFAIDAYVFMPDHAHWLVEGRSDQADLRGWVSRAKHACAYAYAREHRAKLWQPSFYDHVLREDSEKLLIAAYMFNNPVRAGLVTEWSDYPFAGSDTMSMGEIRAVMREVNALQSI